ncbi:high light inducible protein [Acaryochloris sp. IP29b_bin.148]|uniref:high light inducible protein n=1 Tax=Acaryochloris sp. IP29b_bin.148 TaxID=2969218 RepID=UPI0026109FDB|nr:high light inducible protein [Acaryochloris sp. IP29b_bin.148]
MSNEHLSAVLIEELSPEEREQGYVKDEAGLTNKFAVEPEPYAAEPGERPEDFFGFTPFAETLSGRIAMIGFDLLVLTEIVTGKGIIHLLG